MIGMVNGGTLAGLGSVKKARHIVIARGGIFCERQDIIGLLSRDDLGDGLLTPPGINGHRGASQIEPLYERGNGGDFIGRVIHFDLSEHETIGGGPRTHQVHGGFRSGLIKRMAERFAVDGHDVATRQVAEGRRPSDEALGQFLRVQPRQDAPDGVMTGNAMGQGQQLSEPLGLSLAVLLNVFPAVCPTHHRTDRKDEHIDQLVALIGGMGASGIGSGGKMLLKR